MGIENNVVEDIVVLYRKGDAISEQLAVGLTRAVLLKGYKLGDGLARMFVEVVEAIHLKHGEKASELIGSAMYEKIGHVNYRIGLGILYSRLNRLVNL